MDPGRLLVTRVPYWQFRLLGPQPTTGSAAASVARSSSQGATPAAKTRLIEAPVGGTGTWPRGVSKCHRKKSVELPISVSGAELPGWHRVVTLTTIPPQED